MLIRLARVQSYLPVLPDKQLVTGAVTIIAGFDQG